MFKKIITVLFLSFFIFSCTKNDTNLDINETNTMYKYEEGDVVAMMKTTNGMINILLETDLAPVTTANFIGLAKDGYYDGIIFHRVIKDFMIQGGDPEGTGMGGKSIYADKFDDEFNDELSNLKYTISMANSGPDTNGSQFFINVADNTFLDYNKTPLTSKHAVFGKVVEGTENVDKIAKTKTDSNDRPEKEIKIISLEIKGYKDGKFVDYDFDKQKAIDFYNTKKQEEKEAKKDKALEVGDTVEVNYTLKLEDGTKIDSSYDRGETFSFTLGAGSVIKGWEEGLISHKIGDKFELEVAPEDAYGNQELEINKLQLKAFEEAGYKIEAGTVLPTNAGELEILSVDGDIVTVKNGHQLAGKTLYFDIEVVDIK